MGLTSKKIGFNALTKDFLYDDINLKFDVIIGNPPWGKKYTKEEKDKHFPSTKPVLPVSLTALSLTTPIF